MESGGRPPQRESMIGCIEKPIDGFQGSASWRIAEVSSRWLMLYSEPEARMSGEADKEAVGEHTVFSDFLLVRMLADGIGNVDIHDRWTIPPFRIPLF